ncbi:acyl-CoA dehydrogenase [Actinophytocola sp.]|uniref:acyl-CoA dehydrogenase n=1 Tax=Actinophytocola sp. TaxID=1872138 RepID=UPI00389AF1BD
MPFLETDRAVCDKLLPDLRQRLAELPLAELEAEDSPAIEIFRAHGGTNLLVPAAYGGLDASPLDACRVIRALAAQAPSMTVATMMHHFSLGTLFAVAELLGDGSDLEEILLRRVVEQRLLVASGFAEGRTQQGILSPTMTAAQVPGGFLVNGSKKPCSLSSSMDLLTASVGMAQPDGTVAMGLLMLPANTPGVSIHPFWSTFALAGAESNEVRLTDVLVTPEQIIAPDASLADAMTELTTVGLIWFQMTVCAGYTGIASALVEQVLERGRGSASDRAALAVRIESAAALTEGLARRIIAGETDNDGLAAALVTRFAVQDAIAATVNQAVELLGGMAYIGSSDVAYLAAASHCIAFHPPSRTSTVDALLDYYKGYPMVVE